MELLDGRPLILSHGVLSEPTSADGRLVLWFPGEREGGFQHWQRVGTVARAAVHSGQGVRATAVTLIPARQRLTRKFFLGLGGSKTDRTWTLPGGAQVEQCGPRQADLVLVWAEDKALLLDETRLRSLWMECREIRQIAKDLYLVAGANPERLQVPLVPKTEEPGSDSPLILAEQALAAARQTGERRRIVASLIDLGVARLLNGDSSNAEGVLHEALVESRRLGDRGLETDVLLNQAQSALMQNQISTAREILETALAFARESGDRYAEKFALDRLGFTLAQEGDQAGSLLHLEQALAIATRLSDRRHEADLLWRVAVQQAELGRRPRAIASAQAAVNILRGLENPRGDWYSYHLSNYRSGDADATSSLKTVGVTGTDLRASYSGGSIDTSALSTQSTPPVGVTQPMSGPGLLSAASSAARSMGTFVWSGFRMATAEMSRARLDACSACEHHTGARCRVCSCFTAAKARLLHERCPTGKWPS
jgi:tetratricopeptide (TPR) repeat protein